MLELFTRTSSHLTRLSVAAVIFTAALAVATTPAAKQNTAFPSHELLSQGPLQLRLLPGHDTFTFSMYGCPSSLDSIKALVSVMKQKGIGNGFDPGPSVSVSNTAQYEFLRDLGWPVVGYASTADHQVKEGTCRLSPEREKILKILENADIFAASQLGEWGYYFHNLSHNENWLRAVYGKDFEKYKSLMKPKGLSGYDTMPASRRECYEIVKDYFQARQRHMRGWNLSVTGHSHYEAYVGQWGARVIGLELGENIAFTQSKIAFARGASRRSKVPFSIQVSPWFSGSCTTNGPLRAEGNVARGLDAGHSLSFYTRMWLHAWFAGSAMVTPENSINIFFESQRPPFTLTSHAHKASEVFNFTQSRDRGVPFTPIAIVLDKYAGYNAYMAKPWGIIKPTPADIEVRDLFQEQLFPASDHIHQSPFPDNPEASYLRPTPFGEIFDVHLSDAPADVLASYPVILLAGDIAMQPDFVKSLKTALAGGTRLILSERHAKALANENLPGAVEVLEPWQNPITKRPAAISNTRLKQLCNQYLPVTVEGDPVQYQINRNREGWVIELVNNNGVVKFPTKPAVTDPTAVAHVTLRPKFKVAKATNWNNSKTIKANDKIYVTIPPGQTAFIQLTIKK